MSNIDIHNINDYLLYHGHIQNRRNQITNSFRDYMIDLYDIANDQYRISKPRNYSLGKLKEKAYEFYDKNNFQLHDVG